MNFEQYAFEQVLTDVTRESPKVPTDGYLTAGDYPVIDQGAQEVAGYVDDASLVTRAGSPRILFGDHSRRFKFAATDFVLGADGVKSLEVSPGFDPRFVFHALRQQKLPNAGYSRHFKFLKLVTIAAPEIDEQRRIAAILDQADELRAKRRRTLALLDEFADDHFAGQAFFSELESVQLGDVARVQGGITKGRRSTAELRPVPLMTVANVQDRSLDLENVKSIDASQHEIDRYRIQRGDLLLTEGGDPDKLGRGTVWQGEIADAIHQNHIFNVRLSRPAENLPLFVNWVLSSPYGKKYFLRSAKQTTGIATINATQLRSFPLPVVSASRQREVVSALEAVATRKGQHAAHLAHLDELFASLQHRAFTGQL